MKISKITTKVYTWRGKTVPPAPHFCTNAMDILPPDPKRDTMDSFRFHSWLVVFVEASDGTQGIGNAALAPTISKAIIDEYLTPLLIGRDVFDFETNWQRMYRATLAWGRKGVTMAAISAVDIALWDVAGKILHQPVFRMLGGRTKAKIPVYASKLYRREIPEMVAEARGYVNAGFRAVKMRFGYGPQDGARGMNENLRSVAAVREAIGDDVDLMLEAYMGWDVDYTRRILPHLVEFNPRWLEEPVIADDIDGYATLNSLTQILISGGEHEFSLHGFKQLLDKRAISVIQYDTNRVGGITAARKINALAEAYSVPVVPHAGQLHNFHLVMSSFAAPMAEFFPVHDVEIGNELFYYLFTGEPDPKNGEIDLPETPGLGISLNEKFLENFSVKD